jgi:hypothetical protein
MQQQQLRSSLPAVLDPDTLGPDFHERQRQKEMLYTQQPQQQQQQQHKHHSQHHSATSSRGNDLTASKAAQDEQGSCLDVDAFLDSLLRPAATAQAKGAGTAPSTAAAQGSLSPAQHTSNKQPANLTQHKARPSSSCSKGRPVPAWAVTEQEAAAKGMSLGAVQ